MAGKLLTRSDILTYTAVIPDGGYSSYSSYPTFEEIVDADQMGNKLFVDVEDARYSLPPIYLHMCGHLSSPLSFSDNGYSFTEIVGKYIYSGRIFDNEPTSSHPYAIDWDFRDRLKFENRQNGLVSFPTHSTNPSSDKIPTCPAIYGHTTGATMPRHYTSGSSSNMLEFDNGIIFVDNSRTVTSWTMTLYQFYQRYMGSLGAIPYTETGDTSDYQGMFNRLKPHILNIKFVKRGSSSTTIYAPTWTSFSNSSMQFYNGPASGPYVALSIYANGTDVELRMRI